MSTKAIPEGYHTITPMLVLKDSRKAIAFYKKAFGGTERCVTPGPEGKGIMHAEMTIGNSKIMMSDECPNRHTKSAETMGTSPVSFYLYVNDLDTAFQRAVDAVRRRKWSCRKCSGATAWGWYATRSAIAGCWPPTWPTFRRKR